MFGALKRRFRKRADSIGSSDLAPTPCPGLGESFANDTAEPRELCEPAPPYSRMLQVQAGRIELVNSQSRARHADTAAMEARIRELEESLRALQQLLNSEVAASKRNQNDKNLEDKLLHMQRVAREQERASQQLSREHRATAAAQEAAISRLRGENRLLRIQARQYERCLDEVGRRVVATLLEQKSLREEVSALKARSSDLERRNCALAAMLAPGLASSSTSGGNISGSSTSTATTGINGCLSNGGPAGEHQLRQQQLSLLRALQLAVTASQDSAASGSPRDEGYSTMSSEAFCACTSTKAPGELEDLIEEPETQAPSTFIKSLPGYHSSNLCSTLPLHTRVWSKSDSNLNRANFDPHHHLNELKDRVEFGTASWSVEDLGAGLEEDCSEMLWNQASFLHRGMSKQNCDASLPHLASDDTLFDQFSNNFSRLSLNTQSNLPSGLSTSNSSLHSEVAALGRDFSKDFYTLVRVASEKSFSEEIRFEQCLKSPDCETNSDSSSSSEADGGLLQEVLSACGALGRHGKTGWVAVRADLDPKTRESLIECEHSSSDSEFEILNPA